MAIQKIRGNEADKPTLLAGQVYIALDSKKLFIGNGDGTDMVLQQMPGTLLATGTATLDGTGNVTISNANVTTADRIFLNVSSGNSNMTIKVSSVIAGTSFTITSAGGADNSGLIIGWLII